uniref:Retrovirus-related Pol polyprotein from transposon TNT 1-94 n=1 Tax=Tanacetum cinerariifolium TaxID=118510 RepID=A0A699GQP8_TANCI|nr:retrovirus-related Pol polyprotein from transposon TNT 1-94 [Tanacetum cinerariifolium]
MLTRSMAGKLIDASASECLFADFLSEIEPKGYSHEDGIEYDQTFAPMARMEAIRIFIAFSTYMNFIVFQMDVKNAFLNVKLKEEVYVKQPPGFESTFYLKGYTDYAHWNMDRKSTSCSCQILRGKLVFWSAKKQQLVAMSFVEAEYVAATECCADILWMKIQLCDYDIHYNMVTISCNNTSAISISNNPVLHSKTKHIDIRYHFIREHILNGDIELHFILTKYQLADIFIKALDEPTFIRKFWCAVIVLDPKPPTYNSEAHPLKEFTMMNGKKPFTLDFKTFCESTGLDYNQGTYVSHPSPKAVKVLDGNYSSNEQVNFIQQLLAYYLLTGTKVDIDEIIYSDFVTRLTAKSRQKYISYPRFVSCALEVLLGNKYAQDQKFRSLPNVLSNSNFTKDQSKVTLIELTASMIVVNNLESPVSPFLTFGKKKKIKSQTVSQPKQKTQGLRASGALPQKRN